MQMRAPLSTCHQHAITHQRDCLEVFKFHREHVRGHILFPVCGFPTSLSSPTTKFLLRYETRKRPDSLRLHSEVHNEYVKPILSRPTMLNAVP